MIVLRVLVLLTYFTLTLQELPCLLNVAQDTAKNAVDVASDTVQCAGNDATKSAENTVDVASETTQDTLKLATGTAQSAVGVASGTAQSAVGVATGTAQSTLDLAKSCIGIPTTTTDNCPWCPDDSTRKFLEENAVKCTDLTSLLAATKDDVFVDIWRRVENAEVIYSSETQYRINDDSCLEGLVHNKVKCGDDIEFKDTYQEVKGKGYFKITGRSLVEGAEPYTEDMYIWWLNKECGVMGYYSFNNDDPNNCYWRVALSIKKCKINDLNAIADLKKAKAKLDDMKSIIPSKVVRLDGASTVGVDQC